MRLRVMLIENLLNKNGSQQSDNQTAAIADGAMAQPVLSHFA